MAEPRGGLGSKIGSAFIEVGTSFIGFGDSLASDISNALSSKAFVVGQALESFGQAVFTKFSVPLLAATGANIANFQALDREIRTVLTLFGTAPSLVEDSFDRMAAGIREVSREVGGLERDIGAGLYQTISAGIPEGDAFAFLDVAQMAAIADRSADLTTAVDGLSTVLNAFNLEATQTTEVADVMFKTVALGKTTFGELSQDIGRVAPLAANAGVEFQELFSIIGALTLQGLSTSESISFLRAAITGVLRPTDELNTIFQDLGFTTAEAAIPVLGLQGAFAAVTSAAGGSTSRLQELIGTSEGVSAILGVTGQNASNFGRILEGVSNSAGATKRAFEIMDESIGRAFGRVTEAFDRLSNTFGEMASKFALPVLTAGAGIIDSMVGIIERLRPVVDGLSTAFGRLFGILQVPIIRDIVAAFGVLGVTIYGLIGATGLLALAFGNVITLGVQVITTTRLFKGLQTVISGLHGPILVASKRMGAFLARMSPVLLGGTQGAVKGIAVAMGRLGLSIKTTALITGGLVTAFGAAVVGLGLFIKKQNDYIASTDIAGRGVDKLAESMGILNDAYSVNSDSQEDAITTTKEFEVANLALIARLRTLQRTMGEEAAVTTIEGILAALRAAGNAPEVIEEIADNFRDLLDLDFSTPLFETGSDIFVANLEAAGVALDVLREKTTGFGQLFTNARGESVAFASAMSEAFGAARESGNLDEFLSLLSTVGDTLSQQQKELLAVDLRKAIEDQFDISLNIPPLMAIEDFLDPTTFQSVMEANGFTFDGSDYTLNVETPTFDLPGVTDPTNFNVPDFSAGSVGSGVGSLTADMLNFADEFNLTIEQIRRIGEEGISTYENVLGSTAEAFATAEQQIADAMAGIEANIRSQNPFLDVYAGKVEQSFAEWTKGQQQFRTDLGKIEDARIELENTFGQDSPIVDLFNQAPIEKQAWLAYLGDNLPAAMEELAATDAALGETADNIISRNFDTIVAPIEAELTTSLMAIQATAEDAGRDTAQGFVNEFARQFGLLPGITQRILDETRALLNGSLPSPSFTDPRFGQPGGDSFTEPTIPSELDDKRARVYVENVNVQATGTPEQQAADFLGTVGTLLEQDVFI